MAKSDEQFEKLRRNALAKIPQLRATARAYEKAMADATQRMKSKDQLAAALATADWRSANANLSKVNKEITDIIKKWH